MSAGDQIEQAARLIYQLRNPGGDPLGGTFNGPSWAEIEMRDAQATARALDAAGLLAPAPLCEEWGTQYEDGSGPIWRETWDGKRIRTRKDADAEVSLARIPPQRTMHRYVTDWEAAGEHYTAANVGGSRA